MYVTEQYERETTDKAQKEKDFLDSFLNPILEVRPLPRLACTPSS